MIRLDWKAAWTGGLLILAFREPLATLYSMPTQLLLVTSLVNLAYGCCSFLLATRSKNGTVPFLKKMAVANLLWLPVCFFIAVFHVGTATWLGLLHFIVEGILVGILGWLEWNAAQGQSK